VSKQSINALDPAAELDLFAAFAAFDLAAADILFFNLAPAEFFLV